MQGPKLMQMSQDQWVGSGHKTIISVEAIKAHQNVLSLQYLIFMALHSLYSQYSLLEYIMSHKRWKIISTSRLVRVEMMMI